MRKNGKNDISVKVEGLTRKFGDFVAVDDISLEIKKGEIFGFLGPNGAGKSTTIKMLCGLLLPSGGSGYVAGYDIMNETEEIKKKIGYMSQKFSLYDDLTVEQNIRFFSGIYGVPNEKKKDRMEWALEMAGLKDSRSEVVKNLAGGFKQRLSLGCAILHEPSVIFLDEPTSGVDPISRRSFWDLIYMMSGKGTTVFVTTHYMDEADYCNRLVLIYRGKIIAGGTPDELRRNYWRHEIIEIEADDAVGAMDVLLKNKIETELFGSSLHMTVESAEKVIPQIKDIFEKTNIAVNRIEKINPSLEDV
ncbi:MAG: multidrug ABC transporter ATP-binding protein, partial [Nitrospirae bacterium GWC2_42_7]